jgi:hypothetical protein
VLRGAVDLPGVELLTEVRLGDLEVVFGWLEYVRKQLVLGPD